MAGYSQKSLIEKLGVKEGSQIYIANSPTEYKKELTSKEAKIKITEQLSNDLDFIQFFTKSRQELSDQFPILMQHLAKDGMLWISWPKKAAKVETDLNENIVREIGLREGLVDVKVAAIDEIWSGLKFVYRLKDR